jgi:hypothetical protein
VRFEVLMAEKMSMMFFLDVTPCGLKDRYVPKKQWYLPASPHGVTTKMINI